MAPGLVLWNLLFCVFVCLGTEGLPCTSPEKRTDGVARNRGNGGHFHLEKHVDVDINGTLTSCTTARATAYEGMVRDSTVSENEFDLSVHVDYNSGVDLIEAEYTVTTRIYATTHVHANLDVVGQIPSTTSSLKRVTRALKVQTTKAATTKKTTSSTTKSSKTSTSKRASNVNGKATSKSTTRAATNVATTTAQAQTSPTTSTPQVKAGTSTSLSVIFPLYIYPEIGAWDPLYTAYSLPPPSNNPSNNSATSNPTLQFLVILNPNSGPGSATPDENYVRELTKMKTFSNIRVIGYVRTGWATRSITDVLNEISIYASWNSKIGDSISGIFFDETPNAYSSSVASFMAQVDAAVKSSTGFNGVNYVSLPLAMLMVGGS
jgi:hypothetical protein